ncbi:ubiquitin-like modifier-activating enzyme 7 isoform X4 [Ovis aries]|uniref:ubiquitin-like modifier-activating enzyme 7 isoform X4 n=1 Tax=Ovis aries TaxID=9940 RepID=UPI0029528C99|nr:ubiquitin-like modifier-activating enzyme 7 isoform X4 [Ovis aries]
MDTLETSKSLDKELYSRQLYVLGLPAMRRIQGAKVLLSGLQGLGAEVAKNLVLMGVGSLTLHDPHPTCWSDLAAQVVVLTASRLEEQLRVGTLCHEHGVCFLMADTRGLVGQLFCDFGKNFTVQDPTEAEPLMATIQHISQGSPGILTLREEADAHHFHTGDWVTFSGIEGMVELNGCDPRPLHVREDGTLEIGDTTAFSRYLRGGAVTEVKRAKTVSHEPLDTALLQPRVVAQSPQEVHRARCLHQSFRSLHKFQQLHGRPPKPWDPVDAEMVVDLAQAMGPLKGTEGEPLEEQLDESLVRTVALSSAGGLSPMAAVLGAVAAQEVLKAISGKFMPLDQWLYFDALDCLPEDGDPFPNPEDCAPRRCRYDGQTAVFGADFQEKLSHQHYLLVGAGAVGCELLKGFALMGLGAGGSGGVTVADMDHVELSNLSRQFLFRSQDIHRQKAEVAAEATRRLNADLQVTPLNLQLDPTTEHIFGDDFFSGVDGVAAAVDTFEARDYVAARCTHFLKPLLEAGTTGTRGSAGVFIPHVTENYKAPSDAASEDAPDPVCTVRYIPATTEHTVQWAKGEFDDLFCESAKTINSHPHALSSPEGLVKSQKQPLLQTMRGVLTERPQTWRDCVLWALGHWQLRFHYGITQLLRTYPPDKVQEDGTPFWSGPKQCPQPLEFDASQDTHLLYVLAAANLYAQMHRLPGSQDQTALRGLLNLLPLPDPQNLDRIFASELELDSPSGCKQLHEDLKTWSKGPSLEPLTFEKDNDSNFHVDFVVAAASLRAQNYAIPVASHAETKRIVGRIIPAVVTTTAAVAGLVGLELYKVVGGPRPRHAFRHSYLHLAENYFSRWVPKAPDIQKELQGLRVTMLLHGSAQLYSAGWSEEKQARHLSRRVTELVKKEPGQRVLVLELGYEGEEYDTNFPRLHYKL